MNLVNESESEKSELEELLPSFPDRAGELSETEAVFSFFEVLS